MIEDSSPMDRRLVAPRVPRIPAIIGAVAVVALLLLALFFPVARRWWRADRAVDATTIRTAVVTRGDLQRDISVQARVVAALHPTLFSPAQGIISIKTKAGTQAHKGDVLATIESAELRSALAQAQSLLISLRADLERQKIIARQTTLRAKQQESLNNLRLEAAKRSLARYDRLFKEGLSNRTDYETAQDAVRVAEMELAQSKKELAMGDETLNFDLRNRQEQVRRQESVTAELQRKVEELTVRAPFEGIGIFIFRSQRRVETVELVGGILSPFGSIRCDSEWPRAPRTIQYGAWGLGGGTATHRAPESPTHACLHRGHLALGHLLPALTARRPRPGERGVGGGASRPGTACRLGAPNRGSRESPAVG